MSGAGKPSATQGDWRHLLAGSAIAAAIGIGAILLPDRAPTAPPLVAAIAPTELHLRLDYNFSQFGMHRRAETQ
jgi:anti-sigma-K factor RskA